MWWGWSLLTRNAWTLDGSAEERMHARFERYTIDPANYEVNITTTNTKTSPPCDHRYISPTSLRTLPLHPKPNISPLNLIIVLQRQQQHSPHNHHPNPPIQARNRRSRSSSLCCPRAKFCVKSGMVETNATVPERGVAVFGIGIGYSVGGEICSTSEGEDVNGAVGGVINRCCCR